MGVKVNRCDIVPPLSGSAGVPVNAPYLLNGVDPSGLLTAEVNVLALATPQPFIATAPIAGDIGLPITLAYDNGVGAVGTGVGLQFKAQNAADATKDIVTVVARLTDATAGSEGSEVDVGVLVAGAEQTALTIADASLSLNGSTGAKTITTSKGALTVSATGGTNPVTVTAPGSVSLTGGTSAAVTGATTATVLAGTGAATLRSTAAGAAVLGQTTASLTATTGAASVVASAAGASVAGATTAAVTAGSGAATLQSTAAGAVVTGATTAAVTATAGAASVTGGTTATLAAGTGLALMSSTSGNAAMSAPAGTASVGGATVQLNGGTGVTLVSSDSNDVVLAAAARSWTMSVADGSLTASPAAQVKGVLPGTTTGDAVAYEQILDAGIATPTNGGATVAIVPGAQFIAPATFTAPTGGAGTFLLQNNTGRTITLIGARALIPAAGANTLAITIANTSGATDLFTAAALAATGGTHLACATTYNLSVTGAQIANGANITVTAEGSAATIDTILFLEFIVQ